MCGIAGYTVAREALPDQGLLARMALAMHHRGPDANGIFTAPGVGLAHARLSIVDIGGGAQPMSLPDRQLTISFNGEIFNHIELRESLQQQGRIFSTRSDTEVILHLYDVYGADCVQHLNGDFAFAIWDGARERLMLARDRMGVRPLFYTQTRNGLRFASTITAILQAGDVQAEADPLALDQIFTFWHTLAPRTPFRDIFQLQPGHMLLAADGQVSTHCYWQPQFPDAADATKPADEKRIRQDLQDLLEDSVRLRLRADEPCGSLLSGGLDSSLVSAIAARLSPERLRTFSVTFDEAEFDESSEQNIVAAALGTEHHTLRCPADRIAELFPEVVRQAEQPVLRTGPVPLYALAGFVRDSGVKAVLTGEGADEVFAGYDIFKEAKLRRFVARQPGSLRRPLLLQRLYPYLPRLARQSPSYLTAFFASNVDPSDPLYSHQPRFRSTTGAKLFFSDDLRKALDGYDALDDLRGSLPVDFSRWHHLHQAQYLEMTGILPGYILSSQGDRMSMAHGLEGRYPFLDHRVVEFAAAIPPALKLKGLREKHILRECARDLLPPAIRDRPKQPYRAPDSARLLGGLLSETAIAPCGLFDTTATARLGRKLATGKAPGARDTMALTGILSAQIWSDTFISRTTDGNNALSRGMAQS